MQLVIAGGLRHGSDCAKALALGADACYLGTALLIALNCNKPIYVEDYHKIGAAPYSCHHCHTGRCPVGITTQDPELVHGWIVEPGRRASRQLFPCADLRDPDPRPRLRQERRAPPGARRSAGAALEASLITGLPLAGTNRVFGGGPGWKENHGHG